MFLDVKELAVQKVNLRQSFAPGAVDYHTPDLRQIDPLEVRGTAELVDGQIHITGRLHTRLEMVCARCLEPVVEEVSRDFDLFYRPVQSIQRGSDCRGLCPHCGINLNTDDCRCSRQASDPRMAPLARFKQDSFKKQ
jgi:uncharacterized protein